MAVNFEVASSSSFQDIKKNHFMTVEAAADINDSIKWKKRLIKSEKYHTMLFSKHYNASFEHSKEY